MNIPGTITIRLFGVLHALRCERGLPTTIEMPVSAEGTLARAIAEDLALPVEFIEGVFVNHKVYGLDHLVFPGDRVAFVPPGTPGPHRFALGLYHAGREGSCVESQSG
jgi:molybdopterin converting factor small subunit